MMNGLKVFLVPVLILVALVTGWFIAYDLKLLKADIRALKGFLMALPPPNTCQTPGTPQAMICTYTLKFEPFDKDHPGLFRGYVPKSVMVASEKGCKETMAKIKAEQIHIAVQDTVCRKAEDYSPAWYGFKIEGAKPDDKGEADFYNIPGTESLRKVNKPEDLEYLEIKNP